MSIQRGDIVLLHLPYTSGKASKLRPALVVQNDRDNQRLVNTIVVQITTVTHRRLEPTQLLIEVATPDGQHSGLKFDSVVNCANLFTIEQTKILHKIGKLPSALMQRIDECLKAALELP